MITIFWALLMVAAVVGAGMYNNQVNAKRGKGERA